MCFRRNIFSLCLLISAILIGGCSADTSQETGSKSLFDIYGQSDLMSGLDNGARGSMDSAGGDGAKASADVTTADSASFSDTTASEDAAADAAGESDAGSLGDSTSLDVALPDTVAAEDVDQVDAGMPDAGMPDAGMPDAGMPDAGMPDAGMPDAGMPDAGMPDAGMPDAGMPDAGMPDAGMPDAGMPDATDSDAGAPPSTPPTWWQCRLALTNKDWSSVTKADCDKHHKTQPAARTYGIRWIFVGSVNDKSAWIKQRLTILNDMYEAAKISFKTSSTVTITTPLHKVGISDQAYTADALGKDIAAHLEVPYTTSAAALSLLKKRLQATGVPQTTTNKIALTTKVKSQVFFRILARSRPEEIHVYVFDVIKKGVAGSSSPPGINPLLANVSVVNILAKGAAHQALPHELGHFFGLKHPHGTSTKGVAEVPFNFTTASTKSPANGNLIAALKTKLGATLSNGLSATFLPYDASKKQVAAFETERYAIAQLFLSARYTYRTQSTKPVAFTSLQSFISAGQAGQKMYLKNYIMNPVPAGMKSNNNCGLDAKTGLAKCAIGSPAKSYLGNDPFLLGSITVNQGKGCNLMSYIAKKLKPTLKNLKAALLKEQLPVIHTHANTPVRQMLRNHALK